MLPYTNDEKTVIKSNVHVGANRPLAVVEVTGAPATLPIISITVEPVKNGAGQASIEVDNKSGAYAPDSSGSWAGILWPNTEAKIKLGYGTNVEYVFDGLIDSISMKTYPQKLTVYARDMSKRLLDQTVTDDAGLRSLNYSEWSLEDVFIDLAVRAGFSVGNIYCQVSGITVTITFTHESYADAMTKLCELFNYEYYAGRAGELYCHYVTDRQPEAVDEAVALTGTTAAALSKYPIVTASIRVYSAAAYGGTLYTKDIDYVIVEGSKTAAWTIARTASSSIASGATVYVSYVYAAWVFEEGKDIFSLGYTLDDANIYRTVTVIGKTAADEVCHGSALFSDAEYYNLLDDKVLIVDDDTAATEAACETIAANMLVASAAKARIVEFEAVGNPYLWVGDCIMVIETSSTISEIYRIASLQHKFDKDGYKTNITALYYGYAPA